MKPETRTVNALFERDVRYEVPLYQRPYVWDQEHQWEPLWEDIRVLLDHQLTDGSQLNGIWSHFLGAIVVEQETPVPGAIPRYTVIDGQQRLTTLQVLVAAASRVAKECGAENDAEILADLITNNRRKATGDDLFKVWPTNANRLAFKAVVRPGGPPADRQDDPDNLIDEAYAYFVGALSDWAKDEGPEPDVLADRLQTLRITVCDLLKLVSITLEPGDNAQVIFETLNARGTPLLALDLVKNAVFHEADRQGLKVDQLYEERWKPQLDEPYWRRERRQGRLTRAQGELFLMHWLGMKLRRVIPATELFTTFRKDVLQRQQAPKMDGLIAELTRDAATLRSFDNQPAGSVERLFFERLEALDTTTIMPLVLLLFAEPAVPVDRRRRALRILESWLVRRALLRLTAKNYNEQIPILLGKVAESPDRADEAIFDHLRTGTGEISRWPEDQEVTGYLTDRPAYGVVSQARLAMVLAAVERDLRSKKTEKVTIPSDLSLEHIMPQEWDRNWPLQAGDGATEVEERAAREERIHKIGNLTLTTFPLNAALSNGPWATKRKALNEHSVLLLNSELIAEHLEDFSESDIDARTALIAKRVSSIWPGPNSSAWQSEALSRAGDP